MADVRATLDCGTAQIDANLARFSWRKLAQRLGFRIKIFTLSAYRFPLRPDHSIHTGYHTVTKTTYVKIMHTDVHSGSTDLTSTKTFTKDVWAWGLWDWGSAAFNAVVTTFVFAVYLTNAKLFGPEANPMLGYAMTAAGLIIALVAPALGQAVDRSGRRATVLRFTTLSTAIIIACLFFVTPGRPGLILGLFLLPWATSCSRRVPSSTTLSSLIFPPRTTSAACPVLAGAGLLGRHRAAHDSLRRLHLSRRRLVRRNQGERAQHSRRDAAGRNLALDVVVAAPIPAQEQATTLGVPPLGHF